MRGRLATALLLLALLPPGGAAAQGTAPPEDPVVELRSDLVLVNVAASAGSAFAGGLAQGDFRIAEDGAPQEIAFFGAESTPFAAAILLDTSGSMEFKLQLARAAAARFMDRVDPKDQVAVYTFGSSVHRIQDFLPGRRDIAEGVWDTSASGITKLYDCVETATRALAARPEQRRAILLLSDGADRGSGASLDDALKGALAAGVTLYTIDLAPIGGQKSLAVGEEIAARGVLKGFADKSGGRFFASRGGTDLNEAFGQIVEELGHQYTLGYYSTNARRDGRWRKIAVTTAKPGVSIRARSGYNAPKQ